ncbi:MAG: hypothetical protein V1810_02155 [Candidatus Beckwithbacteria bacterium]
MSNPERAIQLRFTPKIKILSAEAIGRGVEKLGENSVLVISRDSSGNQEMIAANEWITEVILKRLCDRQPRVIRVGQEYDDQGVLHIIEEGGITTRITNRYRFESIIAGVEAKVT